MEERINLRLSKDLFKKIEEFRIEKNFIDKPDTVRFLLNESLRKKKSFFQKILNLFKN